MASTTLTLRVEAFPRVKIELRVDRVGRGGKAPGDWAGKTNRSKVRKQSTREDWKMMSRCKAMHVKTRRKILIGRKKCERKRRKMRKTHKMHAETSRGKRR